MVMDSFKDFKLLLILYRQGYLPSQEISSIRDGVSNKNDDLSDDE